MFTALPSLGFNAQVSRIFLGVCEINTTKRNRIKGVYRSSGFASVKNKLFSSRVDQNLLNLNTSSCDKRCALIKVKLSL
jgi:hypothetical protein